MWTKSDQGAWSIPNGTAEAREPLAGARQQFTNETGLTVDGAFISLDPVKQKSGKLLEAFAVEADLELGDFRSKTFSLEWPPRSGQFESFPELDRIDYFDLPVALRKMLPYQWPLLLELSEKMGWRIRRVDCG